MAKKPHEIRIQSLKAVIWENETASGMRYNTTFQRLYKPDPESEWATSDSFGLSDLLLLSKLADRVHDWILEQKREGE